jgi:type I restriction-modification system DNA methylase subunit
MIELCNPNIKKNGQIESILDPTCGSGGFLSMSIRYLNAKYPNINWNQNKINIHGFDIDENNRNLTLLNLLLETGELFDDTIHKQDTLKNDITHSKTNETLNGADIIVANPPFGLKNLIHAECCSKVKNLKIRGTKGEPLFLQLMMESLNVNGRCAVIIPEGILSNDSNIHQQTRKHLITNYNLKKIILMSDTFFMNTDVKCAILYFSNELIKTSEVEYLEIKYLSEQIKEMLICSIDLKTIIKNNYNLGLNKYVKKETKQYNIKYVKLGDISTFYSKSKRLAGFGKSTGSYPFYTSSNVQSKFCDEPDYTNECLIFGTGGNANIKISSNFSCSADNFVIKTPYNKYIYYWFLSNMNVLDELFHGSTIKHLSKTDLENIQIPIPSIETQQRIINNLDAVYNKIEQLKKEIHILEHNDVIHSILTNINEQSANLSDDQDDLLSEHSDVCENKTKTKTKTKTKVSKMGFV